MHFRGALKNLLLSTAQKSGMNSVLRRRRRQHLLVLTYHGVVPDDQPGRHQYRNTVSVRAFRNQLHSLAKHFTPVSGNDLLNWCERPSALPNAPVLVTFDDGYMNNCSLAAPELEKAGVPAVIHVTTGYIGSRRLLWPLELEELLKSWGGAKLPLPDAQPDATVPVDATARTRLFDDVRARCKRLPVEDCRAYLDRLRAGTSVGEIDRQLHDFMGWDEVRSLDRRGFAIGSHTMEHPILTNVDAGSLDTELRTSKQRIESELGSKCEWFAYPNGGRADYSPLVVERVAAAGYRVAFTQVPGLNLPWESPLELRRVNVPGHVPAAVFDAQISGLSELLQNLRH